MAFIDNTLLAIRDLWSVINNIRNEYDEVCEVMWDELDPDTMEAQSKRMVKMVRKMPRDVRGHDAFDGIADLAKNYMTVVPLVAAILHPFYETQTLGSNEGKKRLRGSFTEP